MSVSSPRTGRCALSARCTVTVCCAPGSSTGVLADGFAVRYFSSSATSNAAKPARASGFAPLGSFAGGGGPRRTTKASTAAFGSICGVTVKRTVGAALLVCSVVSHSTPWRTTATCSSACANGDWTSAVAVSPGLYDVLSSLTVSRLGSRAYHAVSPLPPTNSSTSVSLAASLAPTTFARTRYVPGLSGVSLVVDGPEALATSTLATVAYDTDCTASSAPSTICVALAYVARWSSTWTFVAS